ncbi:ImcF-related family protein [Amaricoccus solimangrovi]|uniref:IcmF-related protein n=1 Tax=Amaricoccus solimangrovi TaxID=2589815 RepID=A0A501WIK9_9RHOB|nr:ImcF-related family protein [Amaricoccus solimangrovi]TPE48200.1 hypothetical protein FJM51_18555 [Amaricoccus solimangrovi]
MPERDAPRTVIRPPPGAAPPSTPEGRGDVFAGLAGPLLALAAEAARDPRPDARALALEARRRAEAFETAALGARLSPAAIGAARDGLIAVVDARARSNPAMSPSRWTRARRRALPGIADPGAEQVARRRAAAEARGPRDRDLARFLRHCEEAVRAAPPAREAEPPPWGLIVPLGVALVLAAWSGWAEWRYAAGLVAEIPRAETVIAAGSADPGAATRALDDLRRAMEEVEARAGEGPLGLAPFAGRYAPGAIARARYAAAADALVPPMLAAAFDAALASEGGSRESYDTIRGLAILGGADPWQPGFLAGWLESRAGADPILGDLAPHAGALTGPASGLPPPDPQLLEQAREIAGEGDITDFALLELTRDAAARALPGWSPAGIPGLADVLVRRSGRPLAEPVPGLFTAAGWAYARGGGARRAIDRASREWLRVTGVAPRAIATEAALLDRLQGATLDAWAEKLADLRVRPFTDRAGALLVSGVLGQPASPLAALFRATWREVGGEDRSRPVTDQQRIAAVFGPTIGFVNRGEMAGIGQLFAGLNIALRATDTDAEASRRRLMDVESRAASIATLNLAPRLVAQVIEDVLAQAAAARGGTRPRAALLWDGGLSAACRAALGGRYPFAAEGADADVAAVTGFLGPDGALPRFVAAEVAPLLDASASPWSWKPEARLSGFAPESAAFFEQAAQAGAALFPDPSGAGFTLAALARSGAGPATAELGGASAAIDPSGVPGTLAWPGPRPAEGLAIDFADGSGAGPARQAWPGPWGLLRFLDGSHPRARDDGRRFLLDVRIGSERLFLELTFPKAENPIAARALLAGLSCPPTL